MIYELLFLARSTARTRRGERPVKMRHPQSGNSTDVMKGFLVKTQLNNTTTSPASPKFCNTNRHENPLQNCWTVEFWLSIAASYVSNPWFPLSGARVKITPGHSDA